MDKRLLIGVALLVTLVGIVWYGAVLQQDAPKLAQTGCHVPARAPHLELHLLNATREELSFDVLVRNPTTSDYRFFASTLEARLYAVDASGDLHAGVQLNTDIDHVAGHEGEIVPPRSVWRFMPISLTPERAGTYVVAAEAGGLCGTAEAIVE